MKSDKEVNEQVDEENQTQEDGAQKVTSNAKNYTSRCTGVGLNKMFTALPEEEKGALRTTFFAPLLLIDPITTMLTLVVEIYDRHLGVRVSPIANELLFVDPEHMTNFRMRRFPKKKNTYGLKEIDSILKQAKLERHHGFRSFYLLRNYIETPVIGAAPTIEQPAVSTPAVGVPAIGSSSHATEIGAVVVRYQFSTPEKTVKRKREEEENLLQQVAPEEGLKVIKDLMVDNDVEVGKEVNLEVILSEYGGDLLEWKKGLKDGEEKAEDGKEQPQVTDEEEVQETMIAKTDIVFFDQEEVVGEAYQASADQTTVVSVEEQTMEVVKTEDEASQVIDVYIKALIQYFDTQYRACKAKEKIVLADVFSC
ncbi:hypothetical protein GIB67_039656 [Kingdonia uniflora]|uniref:Uncharacterized protein n=1 Tax=Kingdonia uniflora TaxID=39325 RepID=A0A7J7MDE6_9MAGN|nr:hypothetical protein GIB67_039656 [Kingdonia uniflora]